MAPIGQGIALCHLETSVELPPMQSPPSYNLAQVLSRSRPGGGRFTTRVIPVTEFEKIG